MDYSILSFSLLLLICNVHSQDSGMCDLKITDLKRNEIDINSYCSAQTPCVVKCCGENEVIYSQRQVHTCRDIEVLKKEINNSLTHINFDYSDLNIYKNNIYKSEDGEISSKKFNDFTLLHSDVYMSNDTDCKFLKSGSKRSKLLEVGKYLSIERIWKLDYSAGLLFLNFRDQTELINK